MGVLTREQITAVDDLTTKVVRVDVPEWGGTVCLRPMNVAELDEYSNAAMRARQKGEGAMANFRSRLVAYCLCDEKGNRLFTDEEVAVLAAKCGTVINRLYEACDELNDISPRRLEDVAGNSSAGQSGSSNSDSPATSSEASTTSTACPSPSSASGGPTTDTTSHSDGSGSRSGGSSRH